MQLNKIGVPGAPTVWVLSLNRFKVSKILRLQAEEKLTNTAIQFFVRNCLEIKHESHSGPGDFPVPFS